VRRKDCVIGQGEAVHTQLFGPFDEALNRAGSVEEAVMAVAMQMNKRRRVHVAIPRKAEHDPLVEATSQVILTPGKESTQ
jgi:hypothetical protein